MLWQLVSNNIRGVSLGPTSLIIDLITLLVILDTLKPKIVVLVGLIFINMSYNDFTLEQLNFIRIHWDYSELCKAIKEKNGSN